MRIVGISFAVLALAACTPAAAPESAGDGRVAVGPIASAEVLEGEYRVAEIGGIDLAALDVGYSVSITADRISITGSCVSRPWAYRFEGERLVTTQLDGPTCRRAVRPEEAALKAGFDGASRVARTPANGVRFEGSGPAITLFSQ